MMMLRFALLVVSVAVLSACGPKPAPDPNVAACPEEKIAQIQFNQRFFEQSVVVGKTTAGELDALYGLQRRATLEKPGLMPLEVVFYQTGLPRCGWLMAAEATTPVVLGQGVVKAVGTQSVKELTARGWVLKEASWPWQRYDFGYLPVK